MGRPQYIFSHLAIGLVLLAWVALAAPTTALAWEDHLSGWVQLEHQRTALSEEVSRLEKEHQKFVETIENLRRQYDRGEIGRRQLEEKLRENQRLVQSLEQLQRRVRDLDGRQDELRQVILDGFDERRAELERELREVPASERAAVVTRLNELQERRSQFAVPLPEADQQRIDAALALARGVADDHPRAMLSAADELEDTHDQLAARLQGIESRISQLEQTRALRRQSHHFGTFDRFFDEGERGRTIARFEQAVQTDTSDRGEEATTEESAPEQPATEESAAEPGAAPSPDPMEEGDDAVETGADYGFDSDADDPSPSPGGNDGGQHDHSDAPPASDEPTVGDNEDRGFFDDESQEFETVIIQSEPTEDSPSTFSDRELDRDLRRLRQERERLEEQADELRRQADELRRRAVEVH